MSKIGFGVGVGVVAAAALSFPVQADGESCWGAATAAFAQQGSMGEHSSMQETPRVGLRNLARSLHDIGVLPDDSMDALGAFVVAELGMSVEACG